MRVLREGGLYSYIAILLAFFLVMAVITPNPAFGAAAETKYELRSGDTTFGNDLIITGMGETVFHQQALASADNESLGISFPDRFSLNAAGRPGVGMTLPAITQTSLQSYDYTSTGFFNANLPFYPCCNYGATPVGVGLFGLPSPVTPAKFRGNALLFPGMVSRGNLVRKPAIETTVPSENESLINKSMIRMNQIVGTDDNSDIKTGSLDKNTTEDNNTTDNIPAGGPRLSLPPVSAPGAYHTVLAAALASRKSNVIDKNNESTAPMVLSCLSYDFDASVDNINRTPIVERLWRNSHLACLLDMNFEGDASYPIWIAPHENMTDVLQWRAHDKILSYAMNETKPGANLTHAFWDI